MQKLARSVAFCGVIACVSNGVFAALSAGVFAAVSGGVVAGVVLVFLLGVFAADVVGASAAFFFPGVVAAVLFALAAVALLFLLVVLVFLLVFFWWWCRVLLFGHVGYKGTVVSIQVRISRYTLPSASPMQTGSLLGQLSSQNRLTLAGARRLYLCTICAQMLLV